MLGKGSTGEKDERLDDRLQLPRYDGQDFSVWKAQVEAFLDFKDKKLAILKGRPRQRHVGTEEEKQARVREIEEYDKVDRYVKPLLLLALDNKHAKLVLKCKTSKEIWDRLSALHEQRSNANKIVLQKEFFELSMRYNETVHDYIGRAEYLHGVLTDIGVSLDEATLAGKIVSGLPRRYLNFMSHWSSLEPTQQTMVELIARLSAEEQLISKFRKFNVEQANVTETHKERGFRGRGGSRGRGGFKGRGGHRGGHKVAFHGGRKNVKACYICGEEDHLKRDCPKRKVKDNFNISKDQNSSEQKEAKPEESIIVEEFDVEELVEEAHLTTEEKVNWIVDSGATSHMTYDKQDFISYTELDKPIGILFGSKDKGFGEGRGDVRVKSFIGNGEKEIVIKNVLYVPRLRRKLISFSAAARNNCTGRITNDKFEIIGSDGKVKIEAKKRRGLYFARVERIYDKVEANVVEKTDEAVLWHERFGHINKKTLIDTSLVVEGMSQLSLGESDKSPRKVIDCISCVTGKQTKFNPPLRTQPRSTKTGKRVHLDICGPVGQASFSGNKYFLLLKDEYTNYRFIYCMKSREEAFNCIKQTVGAIFSETGSKVRSIISDCGSEFTSNRMQTFLLDEKIIHHKSAPHTATQNGFIERENRTVMGGVRSMLAAKKVSTKLWDEAAATFIYLLNRSTNRNIVLTPFELYYGRKPRVSHLRVFGCLAMVKVQQKKRSGYQQKLEERSRPGIMVGYEQDYTYRIFQPDEEKIIVSRDVIFDESRGIRGMASEDIFSNLCSSSEDEDNLDDEAMLAATIGEPASYRQALRSPQSDSWRQAMDEEYSSLLKNKTWSLVELPKDRKAISCKWVFKAKYRNEKFDKFKARLVARGFTQQFGFDYTETFSPVAKMHTVRLLLVLANEYDLELMQIDVKTAFLYGSLEEEIYMQQPEGYERGGEKTVCKLNKAIYGLKQASRQWNACFSNFLKEFRLKALKSDTCVFISENFDMQHVNDKPILIICIYVDDGLIISNSSKLIEDCVNHLKSKFEITKGEASSFVGLQLLRNRERKELLIHQSAYLKKVMLRFEMNESKASYFPMSPSLKLTKLGTKDEESKLVEVPYRQAVGSLLYAANGTRPDIAYAVGVLSRYLEEPRLVHWKCLKGVMRYVNTSLNVGIRCQAKGKLELAAYSDADYAGCLDTRKSTTGCLIMLYGTPIIWKSRKQQVVATSTCQSEFIAAATTVKELLWIRNFMSELNFELQQTKVYIDNQGTIKLIVNNQSHDKTKHFDVALCFIRDISDKQVRFTYIATENQVADFLTKPLSQNKFEKNMKLAGMSTWASKDGKPVSFLPMFILITLIFLSGWPAAGFLLKERFQIQPRQIVMAFGQPCDVFIDQKLMKELMTIKGVIEEEVRQSKKLICRSRMALAYEKCAVKHAKLLDIMASYPINVRTLTKRGIIDDVYEGAVEVARLVTAAATLWIKGTARWSVEQTVQVLAKGLVSMVKSDITDRYGNRTIVPRSEIIGEIERVSENAVTRYQELAEVVREQSYPDEYLSYCQNEMEAADVLLRSIRAYLKRGRIDTQALGELIEDKDLSEIDPENIIVRKVLYHVDGFVHFFFDVVKELSLFERIILGDIFIIIGFVITVVSIMVVVCLYYLTYKKVRQQDTATCSRELMALNESRSIAENENRSSVYSRPRSVHSRGDIELPEGEANAPRGYY